jgi:hypothetical protein
MSTYLEVQLIAGSAGWCSQFTMFNAGCVSTTQVNVLGLTAAAVVTVNCTAVAGRRICGLLSLSAAVMMCAPDAAAAAAAAMRLLRLGAAVDAVTLFTVRETMTDARRRRS